MPLRDYLGFRLVRQLSKPNQNNPEPLQIDLLLERSHLIYWEGILVNTLLRL